MRHTVLFFGGPIVLAGYPPRAMTEHWAEGLFLSECACKPKGGVAILTGSFVISWVWVREEGTWWGQEG